MGKILGLCFCTYWGEKEHRSRCRNTNSSLPLPMAVDQLYLWLKTSLPCPGGAQAWLGLPDHMDEALLPPGHWILPLLIHMQYVLWIPLVLSTDFAQHSASRGSVQDLKQDEPSWPWHSHLCLLKLPLCTWAVFGWRGMKAVYGSLGVFSTACS